MSEGPRVPTAETSKGDSWPTQPCRRCNAMYSVVLMMAMTGTPDAAAFGHKHGCDGGCYGCTGYVAASCYGCQGYAAGCCGCQGTSRHAKRSHGCCGCTGAPVCGCCGVPVYTSC